MKISLIAAIAENNAIGSNNQLLWHIKEDLQIFKKVTLNHVIIMGRKSFESIGGALPKRTNVVITRNEDFVAKGAQVFNSINAAFKHFKDLGVEEVFVIGGGEIYKQSLTKADILHISHVHTVVKDAEVFFPEVNWDDWKCVSEERYEKKEGNDFAFDYKVYHRI